MYFGLLQNEEINIRAIGGSEFLSKLHNVAKEQQVILKSEVFGYMTRESLMKELLTRVKDIRIAVEEKIKEVE